MMAERSFGKQFEQKFRENWITSMPGSFILRLNDQVSGYNNSNNLSDFICFTKGILFPIETKSIQKVSFPFTNLVQYDRMEAVCDLEGVLPLVVMWFVNSDRVLAVPIKTIRKMKKHGLKSLNPNTVDREKYYMVDIPSVKLRTFMNSDYSCLTSMLSNEEIETYGS